MLPPTGNGYGYQFSACQIGSVHWHVSSIFAMTLIKVPFSNAAATRSLSANCLFTSSAVLCVPSLIRTSTRNRGGRDCSSRTRTPSPMTVARLQCVIVGVTSTVTVRRGEAGTFWRVGVIAISGRETTASAPNGIGCSGSDIVDTRSIKESEIYYNIPFAHSHALPYISCSSIGSSTRSSSLSDSADE
jgi:hypothetical protein